MPTTSTLQIEELLYETLAGIEDPAARSEFLDQTCHGNAPLRARLERLIAVREEAEDFFQTEPAAPTRVLDLMDAFSPAPDGCAKEGLGTRIGRYRLLDCLGEGGCGVVYQAEQVEPVKRRVALKIIRVGFDSESLIARFEMERQALALMDHPNIARVLDAGTTGSGRPFFVMEIVEGQPITGFCDSSRLDLAARLRLFIPVCMAIQHAHQKGIIHCDIKPSNVMVTLHDGAPMPRVIDFGIARAAEGGQQDLEASGTAPLIGTPAYMSPEQVDGNNLDVDTRSDIYSLGALLYELVAGCPPHDPEAFRDAESDEIRQILLENPVVKPSARFRAADPTRRAEVAAARRTDPERLAKSLRGDLDAIIMKAMAADRQRRYGTASELAADISRHLTSEPVAARGNAGGGYRFRKLVRRNKVAFAAGSIAVLGLTLGFGTSTVLLIREARARQEQERLRGEAEMAQTNEFILRRKAQAGEKVAQAAVLINQGKVKEADELLAQISMADVPSSLESANAYRMTGEWLLGEGRRQDASLRFSAVAQAISRVDKSTTEAITIHFVSAAAAVADAGDFAHYEELRHMAAERFSNVAHPIVSDEVVKTCLIRPPTPELLARIDPLIKSMEHHLPWDREDKPEELMEAWQIFSLTLASYRKQDFSTAESWARRCLRHPNVIGSRNAAARIVLAMALQHAGHPEDARNELETARREIEAHFNSPFQLWTPDGHWFDWMIARVLLREADEVLKG
jgi:hypothetical protein